MKAKLREKAGKLAVNRASSRDEAVLNEGGIRLESVKYDFTEDGGAQGDFSFRRKLPAGAIVTRVFSDELTTIASGGAATVQLKAGSTNLTDALTAVGGNPQEQHNLASSAEAIKISTEAELTMTIATADLTAGELRWYVEYILANDE